ncbi:GNAT family N-acetyltransferase [Actinotalea sp. C106]|uniref:GNAT family N-acetyltransferase n=1 Tax=Actinotalea sp. C106 TaxID=2908644 RepID=UPI002028C1C0|nr:GNAT family N-acetyltransferase [Actinotalea sp. C106]
MRAILEDLPAWFGQPEATEAYVTAADTLPNYFAVTSTGEQVGALLVEQHFPETAEIHLMAVKAAWHRRGVGNALLTKLESDLLAHGTRMLTVKTLGQAHPDDGYRRTRLFYEAHGFLRLEEFTDLWPGTPCLFMAKHLP